MQGRIASLVLLLSSIAGSAVADNFCGETDARMTIREELKAAHSVVLATPKARYESSTDLVFHKELKGSGALPLKYYPQIVTYAEKVFSLPQGLGRLPYGKAEYPFLMFFDKGKCRNCGTERLEAYRGIALESAKEIEPMEKYVRGALAHEGKKEAVQLKYFFDFLDSPVQEIARDAHLEFAKASPKAIAEMAAGINPAVLRRWLADPERSSRHGLYAWLLGLGQDPQGNEANLKLLKKMMEDPVVARTPSLRGIMVGYVLSEPEGWMDIAKIFGDGTQGTVKKLAALQTARYLYEHHPDVVDRDLLIDGVSVMLKDPQNADFAIAQLARWGRWEKTRDILELAKDSRYDKLIVVKNSLHRFAFAVKLADKQKKSAVPEAALKIATDHLDALKKADPTLYSDLEEEVGLGYLVSLSPANRRYHSLLSAEPPSPLFSAEEMCERNVAASGTGRLPASVASGSPPTHRGVGLNL